MQLAACNPCRRELDVRWRVVHFEALAVLFSGQGIAGRVRGLVSSHNANDIAAIGEEVGLEIGIALLDSVTKQLPLGLAVATVINAVEQLIVIGVVRSP